MSDLEAWATKITDDPRVDAITTATASMAEELDHLRNDIAAAEARGRQQMIDALRTEAKRRRGIAERDGTHTPVLQAEAMEWFADQRETPTPRGYDYDTEGLGGT